MSESVDVEQAKAAIRETMQQVRFWPLETVKARLEAELDALVAAARQEAKDQHGRKQ